MSKKTICLITNWYPTKENPYVGLFFKEQAFATAQYFDYIVVHYKEKKRMLLIPYLIKSFWQKVYVLKEVNREQNTLEYDLIVQYPGYLVVVNLLFELYEKYVRKRKDNGVGRYVSKLYQKKKRKMLSRIFKEHFSNRIDVLYCVDAQSESSTLRYISEALKIPYMVSEHAPIPWPGQTISNIEHEAMEKADAYLAISCDKIRQTLLQNIKPRRFAYVGNLVDEGRFVLRNGDNEIKTFLIVAAHSFYKNYDMFVNVMNRLKEIATIPFKVMIVGYAANKGYSERIEEFEEQISKSKFADDVIMIPEVPHEEIQDIYRMADAFVMTSIQEGQPVSAMEAACCGLPIFSTMCGGVEDYVDKETGRIFPMNDIETFARTLNDYLKDQISFDSAVIRAKIVSRFGRDAFVTNFRNIVYEVLDDARN